MPLRKPLSTVHAWGPDGSLLYCSGALHDHPSDLARFGTCPHLPTWPTVQLDPPTWR